MDTIFGIVGEHWAFLAISMGLALIGQISKTAFFTRERIAGYYHADSTCKSFSWWANKSLWWGRKTLPLHPVFAGGLLGMLPDMPTPSIVTSRIAAIIYFAFAGIMSTWIFSMFKGLLKKHAIDIDLES